MSECTTEEISTIITEFKNGKASYIPIHVITLLKKLKRYFSYFLCIVQ